MEHKKRVILIRGKRFEVDISNRILICLDDEKLTREMNDDDIYYFRELLKKY